MPWTSLLPTPISETSRHRYLIHRCKRTHSSGASQHWRMSLCCFGQPRPDARSPPPFPCGSSFYSGRSDSWRLSLNSQCPHTPSMSHRPLISPRPVYEDNLSVASASSPSPPHTSALAMLDSMCTIALAAMHPSLVLLDPPCPWRTRCARQHVHHRPRRHTPLSGTPNLPPPGVAAMTSNVRPRCFTCRLH